MNHEIDLNHQPPLDTDKLPILKQQRDLLAIALERAGEAIAIFDHDGCMVYVNQVFEQITGFSSQELVGQPLKTFLCSGYYHESFQQELWHTLQKGQIWRGLLITRKKDESTLYQEATLAPMERPDWLFQEHLQHPSDHTISFYIGIYRNIPTRKQAEIELQRQVLHSHILADLALKVRQSLALEHILQTTVQEVRQLLQVDRVVFYRLPANGQHGHVTHEAVSNPDYSLLHQTLTDSCFEKNYHHLYREGRVRAIADVEKAGLQPCHVEFLQKLCVKANLVVPILQQQDLWGLLIVHHCGQPRLWSAFEIELLKQLADQLAIAISQAQLVKTLREREVELQQALNKERELSELKSRFVATVSHEFRTPLATIAAASNLLRYFSHKLTEQEKLDRLNKVQEEVNTMTDLLEDTLFFWQADAGKTRFHPTPIDLEQFCRLLIREMELTTARDRQLIFETVGDRQIVQADEKLLGKILTNLLSNALKYSSPESCVWLRLLWESTQVTLQVIDQGIGIPEQEYSMLFDAFYRASNVGNISGTGLGLYIIHHAVKLHQGTIAVTSQVGHGTTFTVTLPILAGPESSLTEV